MMSEAAIKALLDEYVEYGKASNHDCEYNYCSGAVAALKRALEVA
jgi:hypothetical protein